VRWTGAFLAALFCLVFSSQASARCVVDSEAYRPTVQRWTSAIQTVGVPGKCWIGTVTGGGSIDTKHRNGKRDTIIFMPTTTNMASPTTLVYWWHGLGGFGIREFRKRILPNIVSLSMQGHNFILVISELPWSTNTRTPTSRQGHAWTGRGAENFTNYHYATLSKITQHIMPPAVRDRLCRDAGYCILFEPSRIVIIGHSAGGSALKSAARSGALDIVQPNRIIFSDAGYGRWTDTTWYHHVHDHSDCEFVLLVRKWDKPHRHTMRFLRRFRNRIPAHIHLTIFPRRRYSHTAIGDQALMWALKRL
jgi:hypothetical protein